MSSMARILGAPETVPAGKMERKASNLRGARERERKREGREGERVSAGSVETVVERRRECGAPRQALAQLAADLAREVHDVRELLDLHERVDDDRLGLAHAVDVVAREVDEHDVLGAVLDRGRQLGGEGGVLCRRKGEEGRGGGQLPSSPLDAHEQETEKETRRRTGRVLAPPDRARDGVVRHLAVVLDLAQALWARADELRPLATLDVEHVRRRVELTQVAVAERLCQHDS